MLQQEIHTIDRVMYKISHDLGASSRAMVELPKWIAEDMAGIGVELPDEVVENLDFLMTNAQRLDRMLRDLLEYSRVGRFQSQEKIDLDAIVAQVLSETPLPADFELKVSRPDQPFASAEPDFSRVVGALLSNAIKHHDLDHGCIRLSVSTDANWITVTVIDDGPGIAAADRTAALDLLRTLRPRDEVEGSGMGLSIAARVAALNGGSLTISEALRGRGCQVSVRLRRGPRLALTPMT